MSPGRGNQALGTNSPLFVPADADGLASASRSGVGPNERPVIGDSATIHVEAVHLYDQIREGAHESLRRGSDRRTPNGWGAFIDLERPTLSKERGDARRILAAPGSRAPDREPI